MQLLHRVADVHRTAGDVVCSRVLAGVRVLHATISSVLLRQEGTPPPDRSALGQRKRCKGVWMHLDIQQATQRQGSRPDTNKWGRCRHGCWGHGRQAAVPLSLTAAHVWFPATCSRYNLSAQAMRAADSSGRPDTLHCGSPVKRLSLSCRSAACSGTIALPPKCSASTHALLRHIGVAEGLWCAAAACVAAAAPQPPRQAGTNLFAAGCCSCAAASVLQPLRAPFIICGGPPFFSWSLRGLTCIPVVGAAPCWRHAGRGM